MVMSIRIAREALATKAFVKGGNLMVSDRGKFYLMSITHLASALDERYVDVTLALKREITDDERERARQDHS
jgi:hypothetical protein